MAKLSQNTMVGRAWTAWKGFLAKWWRWIAAVAVLALIVAVCALILAGYWVSWTGFGGYYDSKGDWQPEKKLWDWLELVVIPLGAAIVVGLFGLISAKRESAEEERATLQRELEQENARDGALRVYLVQMSQYLLQEGLLAAKPESVVRVAARAQTLALLRQLDGQRKGLVLAFLYESGLVHYDAVIDMTGADLRNLSLPFASLSEARLMGVLMSHADLSSASLEAANLSGATLYGAILKRSNLRRANLDGSVMSMTDLSGAILEGAALSDSYLNEANLGRAYLHEANLRDAQLIRSDLSEADLRDADLCGAILLEANLTGANLHGANVTHEQLAQAASLEGATMPDGTVHE